ncbi:prephenate dehydratase [bacterium]|nr:prephenate dehydratase [bacterium]MBU2599433.1 prephenate dehydratase [bacterium]
MNDLTQLRKEIDRIDSQILELLNQRLNTATSIGQIKKENGIDIFSPDRENRIIKHLISQNKGLFSNKALSAIFSEIISASRNTAFLEKIAYLGPEATFTHLVAKNKFGSSSEYLSLDSIEEVFAKVEKREANYGVVPIENSNEGVITNTLDMFIDSDLKICAEIYQEISHCLLSQVKSIKEIKKVYSHSQAFAQTKNWLNSNLYWAEKIITSSTAKAAEIASQDNTCAAIASTIAANIYNLNILDKDIEDHLRNYTRFLVIGHTLCAPTDHDKTSTLFSIKDKPGTLHSSLKPFSKYNINLTKIESRPSKQEMWKYLFFVDLQGHVDDQKIKKALSELEKNCLIFKVLGSYPIGN